LPDERGAPVADDPGKSEQASPNTHTHGSRPGERGKTPWREDVLILARLLEVEKRHFAGQPNTLIAVALGVDEKVIRNDVKRLKQLWLERIGETQQELRSAKVAELADIKHRAIRAAEWDEFCERAVLFDDPTMPDSEMTQYGLDPGLRVARDEKGAATFRGQKAQNLNVARQSVMDQAKVLGLVVDKQEIAGKDGGAIPIAIIEPVPPQAVEGEGVNRGG
jgi:hypothetical protein